MLNSSKNDFIISTLYNNSEKVTQYSKQSEIADFVQRTASENMDEKVQSFTIKQGDISQPLQQLGFYQKRGHYIAPPNEIAHDLDLIQFANILVYNKANFKILLARKTQGELILGIEKKYTSIFSVGLKELYQTDVFIFKNDFNELLIKFKLIGDLKNEFIPMMKALSIYVYDRINSKK